MRNLKKIEKYFLRRRSGAAGILPLYSSRLQSSRKFSYSEGWIHIIPFVIFLCVFLLWWFSGSDSMVWNNGGGLTGMTTKRAGVEQRKFSNETRVDFALLAKAAKPPYASISRTNPVGNQSAPVPANAAQNH